MRKSLSIVSMDDLIHKNILISCGNPIGGSGHGERCGVNWKSLNRGFHHDERVTSQATMIEEFCSYPNQPRHRRTKAKAVKAAEARLKAIADQLEKALDLLDRTAEKVLDMYMLLPAAVSSRLHQSTFEIFDRIDQAHCELAAVSKIV